MIQGISRGAKTAIRSARIMGLLAVVCAAAAVWAAGWSKTGEKRTKVVESVTVSGSCVDAVCELKDTASFLTERMLVEFTVKCSDKPLPLDRAVFRSPDTARAVANTFLARWSVIARTRDSYQAQRYLTVEAIEEAIKSGADRVQASRARLRWRGVGAMVIGLCAIGFASVAIRTVWPRLRALYWGHGATRRCTACGYSIEPVQASVCPECGAPIEGSWTPGPSIEARIHNGLRRIWPTLVRMCHDRVGRPFLTSAGLVIFTLVVRSASTAIDRSGWSRFTDSIAVLNDGRVRPGKQLHGTAGVDYSTVDVSGWMRDTSEMFVERYSFYMRVELVPVPGADLRSESRAATIAEAVIASQSPQRTNDPTPLARRHLFAHDTAGAIASGTDRIQVSGASVKWCKVISLASACAAGQFLVIAIVRGWRRLNAGYRSDMGEAVCASCGYSVAEIEQGTCPVCERPV